MSESDLLLQHYAQFFDPFAKGNVVGPSNVFPDAEHLSGLHVDAPPPYSPAKSVLQVVCSEAPARNDSQDDRSMTYNATTELKIHGQGTVVANCVSPFRLLFTFSTSDTSESSLYVEVTVDTIEFWYGPSPRQGTTGFLPEGRVVIPGSVKNLSLNATEAGRSTYLHTHDFPARYWLSVDHNNGVLLFGRDYTNLSLALYEAKMKKWVKPGVWEWTDKKYEFIEKLVSVSVLQQGGNFKKPKELQLVYQPLPVVAKPTPLVVSSDSITLDQMAIGSVMVPANLSPECQRLYGNVAGAGIALDTPDFLHFSEAIEYSVNTPGKICHTILEQKASEFGKPNYNTTYLRITLGSDLGNSPGAPYVLEIWPDGHWSPIHKHSDAHAVIKVLHGNIKAYYFTSLHDAHPIGPPVNLQKGDVTWLDPENYQVHQLSNESGGGAVCCTIQCYAYSANDTRHYEKFDYIDEDKKDVKGFEPNSDMRFDVFKAAIKKEWEEHQRNPNA